MISGLQIFFRMIGSWVTWTQRPVICGLSAQVGVDKDVFRYSWFFSSFFPSGRFEISSTSEHAEEKSVEYVGCKKRSIWWGSRGSYGRWLGFGLLVWDEEIVRFVKMACGSRRIRWDDWMKPSRTRSDQLWNSWCKTRVSWFSSAKSHA